MKLVSFLVQHESDKPKKLYKSKLLLLFIITIKYLLQYNVFILFKFV